MDETDPDELGNVGNENHAILVPKRNISNSHFLIVLYGEEGIPQIIGSEFIEEIFTIFSIFPKEGLYIGFNSICAGAKVNQLHIETLNIKHIKALEDFGVKKLPIEKLEYKQLIASNLKNSTDICSTVNLMFYIVLIHFWSFIEL